MIPPEKEWFRPPQFHRLGYYGDGIRFLWVAEPVMDDGVYGVVFRVSDSFSMKVCDLDAFFEKMRAAALKELYRRIDNQEKHPEGCEWKDFEWNPMITRDQDGAIHILHPGRIISVDGGQQGHEMGPGSGA